MHFVLFGDSIVLVNRELWSDYRICIGNTVLLSIEFLKTDHFYENITLCPASLVVRPTLNLTHHDLHQRSADTDKSSDSEKGELKTSGTGSDTRNPLTSDTDSDTRVRRSLVDKVQKEFFGPMKN